MGFYKMSTKINHLKQPLQQPFRAVCCCLSALGLSLSAVIPVVAVDTPGSSPSGGAPSRTASGAPKRSLNAPNHCIQTHADLNNDGKAEALSPMTVLAPTNNIITTADPNPTLFIYIPQNEAVAAELLIQERLPSNLPNIDYRYADILYERVSIPASSTQGPRIVTYALDAVNLAAGKTYVWGLDLFCQDPDTTNDIPTVAEGGAVGGIITCTDGGCTPIATHEPRLSWNETLQATAHARQTHPEQWRQLLSSQGLTCFADVPFAEDTDVTYTVENDPQCFVD